jgi:hypothetical protein
MPYADPKRNREYHERYRSDHRDKLKAYAKDWNKKNRDRVRGAKKVYYHGHLKEMRLRASENYRDHKQGRKTYRQG